MREYVENKITDFSETLVYLRGVIADLSRQGKHPMLIKALSKSCREIDEFLKGARVMLPFNVEETLRSQEMTFTEIRSRMEVIEEWYLPALLNEGPEEQAVSRLIARASHQVGVSWLADNVVSFSRAQSFFAAIDDCAIFSLPRSARVRSPFWPGHYHEIGHAVYRKFPDIFERLSDAVGEYCQADVTRTHTLTAAQEKRPPGRYQHILRYWDYFRLGELFCDVFGTVVAGPAYLFSWVDESVTSTLEPYTVLIHGQHPPNAARTQACLLALNRGFADAPLKMSSTAIWKHYLADFAEEPAFNQICPDSLIRAVVRAAQEEIENRGFPAYTKPLLSPPESLQFSRTDDLQELVNVAMVNFALAPREFSAWQKEITQRLYAKV